MAKKKKKEKEVVTENHSPISYDGNVTVTIKKKNTVISKTKTHNNGTPYLFRALCMCLCSDNDGILLMPYFIDAGIKGENDSFQSLLTTPSFITRHTTILDDSEWKAQFIGTIQYSQLTSADAVLNMLVLRNRSGDQLATIDLGDNSIQIESNAYTAMIEWDMSFRNPTTSTTTIRR